MRGGGGYATMMDVPSKLYPDVQARPCQAGGATDAELRGINSYSAGFALDRPVVTPSASYLDYTSYGRKMMGGRRKNRSCKNRSRNNRSRKNRSRNNRHH